MNEENKVNYYSIIPATIRYSKELKANEKLLYGEITALANKYGYCYAKNRYFAELYHVSTETVSRWFSHLQELGFIKIEIKRNEKKEIIARYIYIVDTPYCVNNQYPYCQGNQYYIDEKIKENNINKNIDDLFYLIINNKSKVPKDFYKELERLELNYTSDIIRIMQDKNIQKIKEIIFTIFCIYQGGFKDIITQFERNTLIKLYDMCKEHKTKDFLNYYKQSIINQYTERRK